MNTSIIVVFAACVCAWMLCGLVELWLDTRWHRRAFPRFAWSMNLRGDWIAYVAGPVGLFLGCYWRNHNGR